MQQARRLAEQCRTAQRQFGSATNEEVNAICDAMAEAAYRESERLGKLAYEETGYGDADDKTVKNQFASRNVWESIRETITAGIVARDPERKLIEIAEPIGVVAALTPSTNPTSTAIYKILIAVKGRNGIVISGHPSAVRCTSEAVRVMAAAAERAGAPRGLIACLDEAHIAGTQELIRHYAVNIILATGGGPMVRAAHSVGKPAYGVGPGNVPVWVDRSADVRKAAKYIVRSKAFDCSLICASEQTVIADRPIADELRRCMEAEGALWLNDQAAGALGKLLFNQDYTLNTKYVGKRATLLASAVGLSVPPTTRVLVAPLTKIGPEEPMSREKLTTILGFMVADDANAGLRLCQAVLTFGGDGHSAVIHSQNDAQVEQMAARLPAFRIIVNSMSTLGSVGFTTGFDPAMTLATGGIGGSITGDNITIDHLIHYKRVGWEREPWSALDRPAPDGRDAHDIDAIVAQVLARLERSAKSTTPIV
jgi:acetaldehyde dehydrogenase (acetylating)